MLINNQIEGKILILDSYHGLERVPSTKSLKYSLLKGQGEEAGITIATLKRVSHKSCKMDKVAEADYKEGNMTLILLVTLLA